MQSCNCQLLRLPHVANTVECLTATCCHLQYINKVGINVQVLNIPTKINKGTVEITSNVALIKAGDKVGASEATLLAKLGIKPFSYGLIVKYVSFDG